MKKLLVFIALFLVFPITVSAIDDESILNEEEPKSSDIYLEDLKLENHNFTPVFDKYNNIYTLITNDYMEYINVLATPEDENSNVEIIGNDELVTGENEIKILVRNEEANKENIYTIILTIIDDSLTTAFFIEENESEVSNIGLLEVSLIILGCFITIIITYNILFHKKSNPS